MTTSDCFALIWDENTYSCSTSDLYRSSRRLNINRIQALLFFGQTTQKCT